MYNIVFDVIPFLLTFSFRFYKNLKQMFFCLFIGFVYACFTSNLPDGFAHCTRSFWPIMMTTVSVFVGFVSPVVMLKLYLFRLLCDSCYVHLLCAFTVLLYLFMIGTVLMTSKCFCACCLFKTIFVTLCCYYYIFLKL